MAVMFISVIMDAFVKSVHDLGVHLDSELMMKPTSRK